MPAYLQASASRPDTRRKVPLLVLLMSHSPLEDWTPGKESVLPSVLSPMPSSLAHGEMLTPISFLPRCTGYDL